MRTRTEFPAATPVLGWHGRSDPNVQEAGKAQTRESEEFATEFRAAAAMLLHMARHLFEESRNPCRRFGKGSLLASFEVVPFARLEAVGSRIDSK